MANKFAVVVDLNGVTCILSTHGTPREAAEALATNPIRWVDAYVVAR